MYLLPDYGVLAGLVLGFTLHTDHLHATRVQWGWNANLRKENMYRYTTKEKQIKLNL